MEEKGDDEEVQEEVAEDYEDLGYPKLQVLIFVECSSVVGINACDIIKEVYCHFSCVSVPLSPVVDCCVCHSNPSISTKSKILPSCRTLAFVILVLQQ